MPIAHHFQQNLADLTTAHLQNDVIWRDLLALTGTFRTFYGAKVLDNWRKTFSLAQPGNFILRPESCQIVRIAPDSQLIEASYTFQTKAALSAECTAIVSLVLDAAAGWRLWVLRTILENFHEAGDVDTCEPPLSKSRSLCRDESQNSFDCVIVGGGQSGLSTAGRLQAFGASYVVLEQNAHVGDNWANRYRSAKCKCTHSLDCQYLLLSISQCIRFESMVCFSIFSLYFD